MRAPASPAPTTMMFFEVVGMVSGMKRGIYAGVMIARRVSAKRQTSWKVL